MAKPVHGNPQIDEDAKQLVRLMNVFSSHEMLRNLDKPTLVLVERYSKKLWTNSKPFVKYREEQSSIERDLRSRPNTE
jgi:hypothetical protein